MKTLALYPEAIIDLENIFAYGLDKFGYAQAEHFLNKIEASLALLCEFEIGNACDEVLPQLYRHVISPYTIFFFRSVTSVEVVRILHGSQDVASQFK